MTKRLAADEALYQAARANHTLRPLYQEKTITDYHYWRIVDNRFPHTRIAKENHILVLKRECNLASVDRREWLEFLGILNAIGFDYDNVVYNLPGVSSIRNSVHCHLYRLRALYK